MDGQDPKEEDAEQKVPLGRAAEEKATEQRNAKRRDTLGSEIRREAAIAMGERQSDLVFFFHPLPGPRGKRVGIEEKIGVDLVFIFPPLPGPCGKRVGIEEEIGIC
ncbi:hypothetical protein NDU88_005836 [Pleurodeles waltl]|uniref:Uncharacterized protein n=1 Tax=Pleurodeles waltl TaxID=8319 RepID=A0AAV7UJ97_PLEWA|nr:hypothetical protein NDU88_005836 [Pleurodeles waltl]